MTLMIARIAMAALVLAAGLGTYFASDREPPSFVLAMWVIPDHLLVDEPFVIQEIFVRQRLCSRVIEHGFQQDSTGFPLGSINVPYPQETGLIRQKFTAVVPLGMMPGPATYSMVLIWQCPFNPVHWFWPIAKQLTYPVTILE